MLLQTEFDVLSTTQTERMLLKSKQVFHEQGEKAGKLLAHQLRQSAARNAKNGTGPDTTSFDPKKINNQFERYYSNLYSTEALTDTSPMYSFLDKLKFPCLSPDDCTSIDSPLSTDEINQAIKLMQRGKVPGPDGFPIEFYSTFSAKLVPILKRMYDEILSREELLQTLTQATISVLLKEF